MNVSIATVYHAVLSAILISSTGSPKQTVFSGPQMGEAAPNFKILLTDGTPILRETDLNTKAKTTLVFLTAIERSAMPLVRVINQYGVERKSDMQTAIIILPKDSVDMRERLPAMLKSLNLKVLFAISSEGAEGPGPYAINPKAMMTLLTISENKVVGNLVLTQPGIADGDKVIAMMAKLAGDTKPPTLAELNERSNATKKTERAKVPPSEDTSQPTKPGIAVHDLTSTAGLQKAVEELLKEVEFLKAEMAAMKTSRTADTQPKPPATPLPGAAPTDAGVMSFLRAFIQPTNTDKEIDLIANDIDLYTRNKPDLLKQAYNGWIRILALKYGTAYSQKVGAKMVEVWKTKF